MLIHDNNDIACFRLTKDVFAITVVKVKESGYIVKS